MGVDPWEPPERPRNAGVNEENMPGDPLLRTEAAEQPTAGENPRRLEPTL